MLGSACSWHQALLGYSSLHASFLTVFGSRPSRSSDVLGSSFLRCLGLQRASEFMVPSLSSYSSSLHLSVQDIAVDSLLAPSSLRVRIKGSKTDPSRKGCFVHIGLWQASSLCRALYDDIPCFKGDASGPLFLFVNGRPLTRTILTDWLRQIMTSAQISGNFSSHSFCIAAATVTARNGILNQWAIGPTTLISFVLGHRLTH